MGRRSQPSSARCEEQDLERCGWVCLSLPEPCPGERCLQGDSLGWKRPCAFPVCCRCKMPRKPTWTKTHGALGNSCSPQGSLESEQGVGWRGRPTQVMGDPRLLGAASSVHPADGFQHSGLCQMYFLDGDGEGGKKKSWLFLFLFYLKPFLSQCQRKLIPCCDRQRCPLEREQCSTGGSICGEKLQRERFGDTSVL